ncbi:MAG: hypothetical protein NVSMB39_3860 [Candidatus Saccharimonadales bacterium]
MLLMEYFRWWYGPGWRDNAVRLQARLIDIYLSFSVPILLPTMFAPWRRIITPPGKTIGDKFRAGFDNLLSRTIGFTVRLGALIIAIGMIAGTGLIGGIILLLWPLLPLLGPALVVGGLL